jgi:hypothetical protein
LDAWRQTQAWWDAAESELESDWEGLKAGDKAVIPFVIVFVTFGLVLCVGSFLCVWMCARRFKMRGYESFEEDTIEDNAEDDGGCIAEVAAVQLTKQERHEPTACVVSSEATSVGKIEIDEIVVN